MGGMIQGVLLDFYGKMFWSRPSKKSSTKSQKQPLPKKNGEFWSRPMMMVIKSRR